ncbi:MAG: hypothetical protein D6722_22065 [Bacteroidetes bacterium]|nr:MAG: hypothetical protein D6722_22065 [Bacteroidota bacterium]
MRKLLTFILLGWSATALLPAQGNLADSVALVYQQYLQIQQRNQALADSLRHLGRNFMIVNGRVTELDARNQALLDSLARMQAGLGDVGTRLSGLNDELSGSLTQVQRLTRNDLLSKEARLQNRKAKIVATARFVKAATASFDAIDAALATSDYLSVVGQLNSPTNNDLGFSLNEEIIELLDEQIIKGNPRFNDKDPAKFREVVQTIMENPITTAVTSSVPALSAIRAVVDLVSGVVIKDKEVNVDDFKAFKASLAVYIRHYEELAQASYDFNANIDKLKVKANALRTILGTYTTDRINTLMPGAVPPGDAYHLNDLIFTYYQWDKLGPKVDVVIDEYRASPRGAIQFDRAIEDPRLGYPLYALTQAQFIQQELESINRVHLGLSALPRPAAAHPCPQQGPLRRARQGGREAHRAEQQA